MINSKDFAQIALLFQICLNLNNSFVSCSEKEYLNSKPLNHSSEQLKPILLEPIVTEIKLQSQIYPDDYFFYPDMELPLLDYYEYGPPPGWGNGPPPQYPNPSPPNSKPPVKAKPKPKPAGYPPISNQPENSNSGWNPPPSPPEEEKEKGKDKFTEIKNKWNNLIDKFKIKDKEKDKKPLMPIIIQPGEGWVQPPHNEGWGSQSGGGSGGARPIFEIWIGRPFSDDQLNQNQTRKSVLK